MKIIKVSNTAAWQHIQTPAGELLQSVDFKQQQKQGCWTLTFRCQQRCQNFLQCCFLEEMERPTVGVFLCLTCRLCLVFYFLSLCWCYHNICDKWFEVINILYFCLFVIVVMNRYQYCPLKSCWCLMIPNKRRFECVNLQTEGVFWLFSKWCRDTYQIYIQDYCLWIV